MPAIFIAVTTSRSMMDTGCALSLIGLTNHCAANGISAGVAVIDSAEIAKARNVMAARMLADPKFTHILFVDSDMAFPASAVAHLLKADKEVIGAIYPGRFSAGEAASGLEKVAQAARRGLDDNAAIGEAARFVPVDVGNLAEYKDSIGEVPGVGMGLCLIARTAFEKLIASGKVRAKRISENPALKTYGFFDHIEQGDVTFGEDFSFCKRWREICGGKVYAFANRDVAHIARVEVRANPVPKDG